MNRLRTGLLPRFLVFSGVGLALLLSAAPAAAQTEPLTPVRGVDVPFVPVLGDAKDSAKSAIQPFSPAHHECPGGTPHAQPISCGGSASQVLTTTDCLFPQNGGYYDVYAFAGTAGQQVTIEMSSAVFDTFLLLYGPSGGQPIAFHDDIDPATNTNSRLVFTLTVTGNHFIAANGFDDSELGAYTLTLTCGGGGGGACTANATTLCLNNNRFRVTATFATAAGQTGPAMAVPETTDTGMFWFFSANNIEAIIKVVNGCGFNQRYWVFAGGLTNVQVTLTVTDTQTGTVRTYTNPQGTAFAPIQDTNAFATCP